MAENMLLLETRMMKIYREQKADINEFCKKYQLKCFPENGYVRVKDFIGKWYITYLPKHRKLAVYHKNTVENITAKVPKGYPLISGYHYQHLDGRTIVEILEKIYDHMQSYEGRQNLPEWVHKRLCSRYYSLGKSKSQKSGRTRAKEQREEKNYQKRRNIKHVLDLIDSL